MTNRNDPAFRTGSMQREGAMRDDRLNWWREAKFGLFIHWGLYSIPAGRWKGKFIEGIGEWIQHTDRIPRKEYSKLVDQFNPLEFNAKKWVSIAKKSGQKYIIITAKHHDGFCIFQSNVGKYNIQATPFGKDPLKELAIECNRQDIKFGFYYSQTQDWFHPFGNGNDWDFDHSMNNQDKNFDDYVQNYVKPHIRELLTNYGPIAVIWFDTPKIITNKQSQELLDLCHRLQPNCIVNGRLGNSLGDYCSTGDNAIPNNLQNFDWETCGTINDTWGFKIDDNNWKSAEDLIKNFIDIVSKGGNFLLNVGPTSDGIIPKASVDKLLRIGNWLEKHQESIYGTTPGPIQNLDWCKTTKTIENIYIHVLNWPSNGKLVLPNLGKSIHEVSILGDDKKTELNFENFNSDVIIQCPVLPPDPIVTVVKIT